MPNFEDFPDRDALHFVPARTSVRCPKCRSKTLELIELLEATTTWEVRDGLLNRGSGYLEAGPVTHTEGHCFKCDHRWRLRNGMQVDHHITRLDPETFEPLTALG